MIPHNMPDQMEQAIARSASDAVPSSTPARSVAGSRDSGYASEDSHTEEHYQAPSTANQSAIYDAQTASGADSRASISQEAVTAHAAQGHQSAVGNEAASPLSTRTTRSSGLDHAPDQYTMP
ncbi:hypothetical protein IAU59_005670 [Kwoniella sp. CBS 9459]